MGRCSFAVGLLCGVLSISAVAQTVSEPILIGPPIVSGRVCVETAIVARATPNDEDTGRVVAAWFEINELGRQIFRSAVTLDGWQTPVTAETVTAQGCDGWNPNQYPDPMVGTSPTTGDIWRGSLIFGPGTRSGFWLQRLPNSSNVFESPYSFECWQAVPGSQVVADKPLVGVGPRAGVAGYEERLVLAYTLVERSGECTGGTFASHNHMRGRQSDDALGQSWSTSPRFDIQRPNAAYCDDPGLGLAPVIVPGGVHRGRQIAAFVPMHSGATHPVSVFYSDDNGAIWIGAAAPLEGPLEIRRYMRNGVEYEILWNPSSVPMDLESFGWPPCVTIDPNDPENIYVVFAGESEDDPGNVDVFYAKGALDPISGALSFPPENVIRITDADLGEPEGADQFMPWGVVDGYHGLNILYYATTEAFSASPTVMLQARYIRRGPVSADILSRGLAPAFDVTPNSFIGHYHMIAASHCMVYPCYMSKHEGETQIYVNRINVCVSDSDGDGLLRTQDATAFGSQYIMQDPRADLNRDGIINAMDVGLFQAGMTCGCGTPAWPP
jgi:hypothetical protein